MASLSNVHYYTCMVEVQVIHKLDSSVCMCGSALEHDAVDGLIKSGEDGDGGVRGVLGGDMIC